MATKLQSINDYIGYLELLAESFKAIGHTKNAPKFFTNIDTYLASKGIKGTHLVVNALQSRFIDNKSDNVIRPVSFELWFLTNCSTQNVDEIKQKTNELERIAVSWVARFRKDVEEFPADRIINYFSTASSLIEMIGPIGDNCYGVSLRIELGNAEILNYDTTLWD